MKTHIDAAAEKLRSSKNSFYRYINPVTVGTATAASIYPVTLNAARQFSFALPLAERWQAVSQTFGTVPARVYFIVVGFSVGYGLARGLGWLRTKLLEVLFRYQGWTNGHSVTTKVGACTFGGFSTLTLGLVRCRDRLSHWHLLPASRASRCRLIVRTDTDGRWLCLVFRAPIIITL